MMSAIKKSDWRFVAGVSLVLIVLTGVPYLIGYLATPSGRVYNGLHALTPADYPVYYAYILQVKTGALTVLDLFTTEDQPGVLNAWWLLVGWLARGWRLSPPVAFHAARLLMIPVFVSVLFMVISRVFTSIRERRIALVFVIFAGGIGGYAAPFLRDWPIDNPDSYQWPIDLWVSEASTFNIIYHTSHFIASITATLAMFLLAVKAFIRRSVAWALAAGAIGLVYFNFHPFYIPTVFGTLGLYLIIDSIRRRQWLWREFLLLGVVVAVSLPAIGYHFWLLSSSEVIRLRALQNVTDISPLPFVVLGYGFLLPGLALGIYALVRRRALTDWWQLLACWGLVNVALIYSPVQFHSRYTQGLSMVFALFTAAGLFWLYERLRDHWSTKKFDFWVNNPTLLLLLFLLLFAPTALFGLIRDLYQFTVKPGRTSVIYYLPADLMAAYRWLGLQPAGQVVLGFDPADKFVPAFSGQKTYAAHGIETLFYQEKIARVRWLYGSNDDDEAKEKFLQSARVDFVLWSEYEKALGDFKPSEKNYLTLVFDTPTARLYRVVTAVP